MPRTPTPATSALSQAMIYARWVPAGDEHARNAAAAAERLRGPAGVLPLTNQTTRTA